MCDQVDSDQPLRIDVRRRASRPSFGRIPGQPRLPHSHRDARERVLNRTELESKGVTDVSLECVRHVCKPGLAKSSHTSH
jgi:hypothetical protein